ncbi:Coatomer subunit beta' [Mycoemilia scoparia]|uniref:Beta'-coat protein n=1 Tax=Mycoemilia scoparia TaxID=417184 RepID=A0A9W8A9E6_9FUNG|nr:Coatomer subunit beta' [Mycoemilia scoparia]
MNGADLGFKRKFDSDHASHIEDTAYYIHCNEKNAKREPVESQKRLRRSKSDSGPKAFGIYDDLSDDSGDDNAFPDVKSLLSGCQTKQRGPFKRSPNALARRSNSSIPKAIHNDNDHVDNSDVSDQDVASTIKVPGELVLAFALRKYYPAKVIERVSDNKYKVIFLDGKKSTLTRKRLLTMFDKEFYTCEMGTFELKMPENELEASLLSTDGSKNNLYIELTKETEDIKPLLEEIHDCGPNDFIEISNKEPLVEKFYKMICSNNTDRSDDNSNTNVTMQPMRGPLTFEEFYYINRLVATWFPTPPRLWKLYKDFLWSPSTLADNAFGDQNSDSRPPPSPTDTVSTIVNDVASEKDVDIYNSSGVSKNDCINEATGIQNEEVGLNRDKAWLSQSTVTESKQPNNDSIMLEQVKNNKKLTCGPPKPNSYTIAVRFDQDVLVPHLIKQLISKRDGCSLSEAELIMLKSDTTSDWTQVKSFEACDLPVRAAKFIARKNWIVVGSDDMQIRVYNYNTQEKVKEFSAHQDYIRTLVVHPTLPYVLSGSDDTSIKLWNWDKDWRCIQTFEGHSYFVMSLSINPKDTNTFASASLDKTVKVWNLGSSDPNFTLKGHENGVNAVDYCYDGDKPYLISGADDKTVKVWDYQNQTCVQTLSGHTQNVSAVAYHPQLPIIITGCEDGEVRVWRSDTFSKITAFSHGLERIWTFGYTGGDNTLAIGYDEGLVVISLGSDEPVISMDISGRITWAKKNTIQSVNVKMAMDADIKDGERIRAAAKELGTCELYPEALKHSPNGRFVAVQGHNEYIIYTALAWRNKAFGSALDFVWALDSNEYAILQSQSAVGLFKNFKERSTPSNSPLSSLGYSAKKLYGGGLLGICSASGTLNLYDWETGLTVRRIDVNPKDLYWSDNGELFTVATEDSYFVLRFNREAFAEFAKSNNGVNDEEGVEAAVEFVTEIQENVKSGCWIGDCFIYTNENDRLSYLVGNQVITIAHFDKPMYLLGYVERDNRVYLADKQINIVSYVLPLAVIKYQMAILAGDDEAASEILPEITDSQRPRVARFLEAEDKKALALEVTTDPEQKFDLAIQLKRLDIAYDLASKDEAEAKWRIVGDCAMKCWKFDVAERCMEKAKDFGGLLLLYTSTCNAAGLEKLAGNALEAKMYNIAFTCYLNLSQVSKCLDILVETNRIPEATLFARAYVPSRVSELVSQWKASLDSLDKQAAAESLADPLANPELFPEYQKALDTEKSQGISDISKLPPSRGYFSQNARNIDPESVAEDVSNLNLVDVESSN